MKQKKRILVTGGLGFIGSAICRSLVKQGYKITIFDDKSRGSINRIKDFKNKIKIIFSNLHKGSTHF